MSFWQPRSVLQLLLIGFLVAVAPLCIAILSTIDALGELAEKHRSTTRLVVEVSQLEQQVQRDILQLERRARQYLALADRDLAILFDLERDRLLEDLEALEQILPSTSPDVAALLDTLEDLRLPGASESGHNPAADPIVDEGEGIERVFALIVERGQAIQLWKQASVESLIEQNSEQAEDLTEFLVAQISLLAAITFALLLLFAYWITRPLKELTQEIQQLGTEGLSHSIEISGPLELKALGTRLEWLRQQLHDSEQQKQQFLRHISHELKTPLASLREGTDLLSEHVAGALSQQQQEIVDIVRLNGIELQRLIENLIDFNQTPYQELSVENINLEELCTDLLRHYRFSIDTKRLTLDTNGTVSTWRADRHKLRTTLDNLLSNAVNYTPEDGAIALVWYEKDANLIVDVANSGEAIPLEDEDRVFEPFFQSAAKRTGPIKGSGIGLSVARECMEAQRGTLELVPNPHFPVCFRLICPIL